MPPRFALSFALLALTLCACEGRDGEPIPLRAQGQPTAPTAPSAPPADVATPHHASLLRLAAPKRADGDLFSTSHVCSLCHSNSPDARAMRDASGRPVSPYDLWQASMMANATRDPLWRAVVSAELDAAPSDDARAHINDACLSCHAPMATREARNDEALAAPTLETLYEDSEHAQLALDGVSCTVCHQIQPTDLGKDSTFTANFHVEPGGYIFGPHSDLFSHPMEMHAGFIPMYGEQIVDSALCGSCHTVQNRPVDAPDHLFTEQSPYLEWRNSDFSTEREDAPSPTSCQDCHVPRRDVDGDLITTRIARNPGGRDFPPVEPRSPYGRHLFIGGNTLIPAILRDNAEDLRPRASAAAFDALIAATRAQLAEDTAALELGAATRSGDALSLPITIRNRTGHKLPSAFPSRRVWLALRVTDASGDTLFASGLVDAEGRILDDQGEVRPEERVGGAIYPHVDVLSPAEPGPLVFEAVHADTSGAPTFSVSRAAASAKDNRLLPAGWSPEHPEAKRTAPVGVDGDGTFTGGSDTVTLRLPDAPEARGPYRLELTLYHQVLSARWADELFQHDTPEVRAFQSYYDATRAHRFEIVARAETTL